MTPCATRCLMHAACSWWKTRAIPDRQSEAVSTDIYRHSQTGIYKTGVYRRTDRRENKDCKERRDMGRRAIRVVVQVLYSCVTRYTEYAKKVNSDPYNSNATVDLDDPGNTVCSTQRCLWLPHVAVHEYLRCMFECMSK